MRENAGPRAVGLLGEPWQQAISRERLAGRDEIAPVKALALRQKSEPRRTGQDGTITRMQCTPAFGSDTSTGGDERRCVYLGNNRTYCTGVCESVGVFGKMSKVGVIEQVNTIWEQRHWTSTKAVHLLQRKDLAPLAITRVSAEPDSPLPSSLPLKTLIHLLPCSFQTV